jgi:hypothetical protein
MVEQFEQNWPENMRPPAAAQYLAVSESYLAKLRMLAGRKKGPAFSKVAGCVIYRRADLDAWIADHVVE